MAAHPATFAAAARLSSAYTYLLWSRDELPVWAWDALDTLNGGEVGMFFAGVDAVAAARFQTTPVQWRAHIRHADTQALIAIAIMVSALSVFDTNAGGHLPHVGGTQLHRVDASGSEPHPNVLLGRAGLDPSPTSLSGVVTTSTSGGPLPPSRSRL